MKYRVNVAPEAFERIRTHARYIAIDCQSPLNATRWLSRVLEAADSLERWPRRCPLAAENDFVLPEVRSMSIDGFLLLFIVDDAERTVTVVNARHGRQAPET